MKLTRNMKIFVLAYIAITALFYWLSIVNDVGVTKVESSDGVSIYTSSMPLIWVLVVAAVLFVLYKTDKRRSSRRNLAFDYHVLAAIIVLIPLLLVAVVYNAWTGFTGFLLLISSSLLLISLGVHFYTTRKNPKGIEKAFK